MVIGERVIYRHPKGRFEVRETTCRAFGNTYSVREAIMTPDEDRRRMPEALRFSQGGTQIEDKPKAPPRIAVSDREAEGFAEMYRDGAPLEEIARRFARTQDTVRSHLRRLGVIQKRKVGFWKIAEIKKAKALIAGGYSVAEVARRLDRTVGSVQSCMYTKRWREV